MSKHIPFWDRVEKTAECWLWLGPTLQGYGMLGNKYPERRAHRYVWHLTRGRIPAGMVVMHKCDNPRCVRPDHLALGTQYDNILDCIRKGRQSRGIRKEFCPRGHRRTLRLGRAGKTRGDCLTCNAERHRLYRPSRSKEAILSRLDALK